MNPVRPPAYPPVPLASNGPGAVKTAAQRAFFDTALGKATAAATGVPQAQTAAAQAPTVYAQPVHRMPSGDQAEPPQKILRPGSLLDIRV